MIKKRFVNKGKDIFQYGEWWCSANEEHCADVIATAINELTEENEKLKSKNRGLQSELQIFKRDAAYSNLQINKLADENEELKKGMIRVVDRYIKNVECNPPSSARTYGKIKGALVNIREDLRSLIGDLE